MSRELTNRVTHLVAESCDPASDKYKVSSGNSSILTLYLTGLGRLRIENPGAECAMDRGRLEAAHGGQPDGHGV